MKSRFFCFILGINLISLVLLLSCSSVAEEVVDTMPHAEEIEMQTMTMCLHGGIVSFDASSITRSGGDSWTWQDDDVVYIQFHNGGSLVRGYGQYDATSQQWEVYYSGAISQLDICEVYYFEGVSTSDKHNVTFDETNAVYADTLADYRITDNVLYIDAMLTPLSSRVRFAGTEGIGMTVLGITHFTGYDADKNIFTTSSSVLSDTVHTDGYTQYFYGVFSDESRRLVMTNTVDKGVCFEKVFLASVLRTGESGFVPIPTIDTNRGWEEKVSVTSVSLSQDRAFLYSLDETIQLAATTMPEKAAYNTLIWTSSDEKVATVSDDGLVTAISFGSVTIKAASILNDSVFATCSITILDANGHQFVDLGLPSGVLWATCNVGASSPEEYGDYYAWGEMTTKSYYSESNYTYSYIPSILPLYRDVVHEIWGGNCRMPTYAEVHYLCINCFWSWTEQNGVKGCKVTSKTNGNSIFLPAAGCRSGGVLEGEGSGGYYWSSEPYSGRYIDILKFSSKGAEHSNFINYGGLSVRAVYK